MEANIPKSEASLLAWTVDWLSERLPESWNLELRVESPEGPERADGRIFLQAGAFTASIAVEARRSLTPREAENLLPRLAQVLHSMTGNAPVLVVAPWLSARTQELLAQQGINYIDRTGNALIKLDSPAVYIETVGSSRNPAPPERGKVRLRGAKAGRLLRVLIDVQPPYVLKELSEATGLAPGYVSRLLDALDREALIERMPRGPVTAVDVVGLLRGWAASYDVFRTNRLATFIASTSWSRLLDRIAADPGVRSQIVITGSVAATRLAPVAAPAMLLAYSSEPERIAEELGLLPADEGANVGFLVPFDPVVGAGTTGEAGLRFAAPSQVAVDCLTGNGRMPAEGEAVLEWMSRSEPQWRGSELGSWAQRWARV
ncbi:MAG TPA: hypothetical protein VIS95_03780 [Solirubrobacterales bacterium]